MRNPYIITLSADSELEGSWNIEISLDGVTIFHAKSDDITPLMDKAHDIISEEIRGDRIYR